MPPEARTILWVDDEIDLLRPHILYLRGKGYRVTPVSNGQDALELFEREDFDIVLLDEMMPGMGGLAVLEGIQQRRLGQAVIMITKSEEENLMNEALGRRITDYLIKPVHPSQIWMAIKKVLESRELERGTAVRDYVRERGREPAIPFERLAWSQWTEEYLRAARWELELEAVAEEGLRQAHRAHLAEMNRHFCRFVEAGYRGWVERTPGDRPLLSPEFVPARVVPLLREGRKVALIVIDCLRLDQWMFCEPILAPEFRIRREAACAILPTATPYARNAIFSGLYPREISVRHPEFWREAQQDETGKNRFERELLLQLLAREGLGSKRVQYVKVVSRADAEEFERQVGSYGDQDLVALVFTFVDAFTHGRSRDAILAEFATDAGALRAHLATWFERSVVLSAIRAMGRQGRVTIVTTDHGNVQVNRPAQVRADRETSTGVRFKFGHALNADPEQALRLRDPDSFGLPTDRLMKTYIFAKEDHFFVYPHNRYEHERALRGSFQHGGISLEEMIVPLATLQPLRSG
jgi:DNA-binding response OmpR family regulator